jgi:hypothetical protein
MKLIAFILFACTANALTLEEWQRSNAGGVVEFALQSGPTFEFRTDDPRQSRIQYLPRWEASGVRIIHQGSDDLKTWGPVLTNTKRGFVRLRVDHDLQFSQWTEEILSRSGEIAWLTSEGAHNHACWAADLDLSAVCLSAHNGVLIAPRKVLFTTHYLPPVGSTLKWLTKYGVVVERTLAQLSSLPTTGYLFPDITVGVLDSEATGVAPVEILPANTFDMTGFRVAAAVMNRNRQISVAEIESVSNRIKLRIPTRSSCWGRFQFITSGDSGSPAFVICNGKPLLVALMTFGGPGEGTYLPAQIAAGLLAEPQMP